MSAPRDPGGAPAGTGLLALVPVTLVLAVAAVTGFPRLLRAETMPDPTTWGRLATPLALVTWTAAASGLVRAVVRGRRRAPADSPSRLGTALVRLRRRSAAMAGAQGVLLLLLAALMAPLLAPFPPDQIDAGPKLSPPSLHHLLGTDEYGRDLSSRLLHGARLSLSVGLLAVALSTSIGSLWGALAGTLGGAADAAMMWIVDLLLSLPRLVVVLTLVGLFDPGGMARLYLAIAVLGLTGWMGLSRLVRGLVLSLREQEFVLAARALGQRERRILLHHLLPNALGPVVVHSALGIGATILAEATLSFLGLGAPPPIATWGSLVSEGREHIRAAWWLSALPGLAIAAAVLSFNLLGDGLRDALDPAADA